ncbi:MAG: hypothetical protein DHS20C18_35720 [Saprospiraceae bacterium]|nr:MAG: hypothetical protein DHS20C18_35720 [Saprospiraceae bacterium]
MKNTFVALILLLLTFSGFSQVVGYDVFGTHTNPHIGPYSLITLDTLKEAKTLNDIHAMYRSFWVASYIAVEVSSTCKGIVKKAASTNDTLTDEQMGILKMADVGCRIDVVVDYIPENTLKDNPPRRMDFSMTMIPIYEAKYPGGYQYLKKYLKENAIDEISATTAGQVELAAVRFNVNEEGQVSEAQIFKTSGVDKVDKLLLEAICNMPKWRPAENAKGKKISQEFELRMGTLLLRCDYEY